MTAEGVCIDRSIVPVIRMTKDNKTRALRPYARGMYWYKCLRVGSAPFSTSVSFNKCFFSIVSGAFGEALSSHTRARCEGGGSGSVSRIASILAITLGVSLGSTSRHFTFSSAYHTVPTPTISSQAYRYDHRLRAPCLWQAGSVYGCVSII